MQHAHCTAPDVLCVGSCGWDILGRATAPMTLGDDVPGHVHLAPGGVACNIWRQLQALGFPADLASVIGTDALGDALMDSLFPDRGDTAFILRSATPTALYLALESPEELVGAVASTTILEEQSILLLDHVCRQRTLSPLRQPVTLIDGNLASEGFAHFQTHRLFAGHHIIVTGASPAKAARLRHASRNDVTIAVNREEAASICNEAGGFANATDAGHALHACGFARAIVTDGPNLAADVCADWSVTARPRLGKPAQWTGAGDRFLAYHIVYDATLDDPELALQQACDHASS